MARELIKPLVASRDDELPRPVPGFNQADDQIEKRVGRGVEERSGVTTYGRGIIPAV